MENCRGAAEPFSVPLGLFQPFVHLHFFGALDLAMNVRQAHKVRLFPIVQRFAGTHIVAVALEKVGKLDFTAPAFFLL